MQTLNVFRMIKQTEYPIYILISLDHSIEQVGFRQQGWMSRYCRHSKDLEF